MRIIYVSHPYGGDRDKLRKVEHICAVLTYRLDAHFVAPWVALCRSESRIGASVDDAMAIDLEFIRGCDGFLMIGGMPSVNGERELREANLTAVSRPDYLVLAIPTVYTIGIEPTDPATLYIAGALGIGIRRRHGQLPIEA